MLNFDACCTQSRLKDKVHVSQVDPSVVQPLAASLHLPLTNWNNQQVVINLFTDVATSEWGLPV